MLVLPDGIAARKALAPRPAPERSAAFSAAGACASWYSQPAVSMSSDRCLPLLARAACTMSARLAGSWLLSSATAAATGAEEETVSMEKRLSMALQTSMLESRDVNYLAGPCEM